LHPSRKGKVILTWNEKTGDEGKKKDVETRKSPEKEERRETAPPEYRVCKTSLPERLQRVQRIQEGEKGKKTLSAKSKTRRSKSTGRGGAQGEDLRTGLKGGGKRKKLTSASYAGGGNRRKQKSRKKTAQAVEKEEEKKNKKVVAY